MQASWTEDAPVMPACVHALNAQQCEAEMAVCKLAKAIKGVLPQDSKQGLSNKAMLATEEQMRAALCNKVFETNHSAVPDLSSGGKGASTLLVEVSASEDWDNGSDNNQTKHNHNENGV